MRKGFDGLCGLIRNELREDPCNGDVFIFINRNRNRIKLLQWEQDGFSIYYKRLEKGIIELPKTKNDRISSIIEPIILAMMLEGVGLEQRQKKMRFSFSKKA